MDDLLIFVKVKFRVVNKSQEGAKFRLEVIGHFPDHGGSFHPPDDFYQPLHRLAGS